VKIKTKPQQIQRIEPSEPTDALTEFAAARGLSPELLQDVGIRVDDDSRYPVVIPYPHLSGIWYERRRRWVGDDSKPKYLSPKHADPHLYNPLGLGPNADVVWITEGEIDCLSLIEIGRPAVGTQGTQSYDGRWSLLFSSAVVVLAFDNDDAGDKFRFKVSQFFDERRLHHFKPPFGEDLNSMLQGGSLLAEVEAFEMEEGLWVTGRVGGNE